MRFCCLPGLLLAVFAVVAVQQLNGQETSFALDELTIAQLHQQIRDGKITCEKITELYLNRIKKFDQPTKLNAIVVVNQRALDRARDLDKQFQQTGKLLPLHGIPVIVKDNYDTKDLPTTGGSSTLKGSIPPDDSFQVKKLRQAGAVILCKSNMATWAYSPWFTNSCYGTTRNPYNFGRVPAGSSGGTAAAVAANFGAVGLGTDTGNSIRGPSSHCCLVGIRPTIGLTSRDGIIPLFLRNDVGGPMCRTVEDCARVLEVIAGYDPNDSVTELCRNRKTDNYISSLDKNGLRGARIGVFRTLSNQKTGNKEFLALFNTAIADLKKAGAVIVDPFEIDGFNLRNLMRHQNKMWVDTFRHDIAEYMKTLGDKAPVKNLDDIIRREQQTRFLANRLRASKNSVIPSNLRRPYSANPMNDPNRAMLLKAVIAAMDRHKIDAFVFPTWNNPPRKIGDLRSPDGNNSFQIPPGTGQPAITVPMGFNKAGLPAGLQFVGRPFAEATLFRLGYSYEQATKHRRAPKLKLK